MNIEEKVVETKSGLKLKAVSGYNIGVNTLCKMKDTGNGFIFKFPTYSSINQENYVCLDYAEAEYIWKLLDHHYAKDQA